MTPIRIACDLCATLGLDDAATHLVGIDVRTLGVRGLSGDSLHVCRQHAETLISDPALISWERLTS